MKFRLIFYETIQNQFQKFYFQFAFQKFSNKYFNEFQNLQCLFTNDLLQMDSVIILNKHLYSFHCVGQVNFDFSQKLRVLGDAF